MLTVPRITGLMISLGILNHNPAEMGFEGSGIVRAVGSGVQRLSVGDRVLYMGSGCFSTYLTMQETLCIKIDDTMSFEQAAVLPGVYATALMALVDKGNLQQGQVSQIRVVAGDGSPPLTSIKTHSRFSSTLLVVVLAWRPFKSRR